MQLAGNIIGNGNESSWSIGANGCGGLTDSWISVDETLIMLDEAAKWLGVMAAGFAEMAAGYVEMANGFVEAENGLCETTVELGDRRAYDAGGRPVDLNSR